MKELHNAIVETGRMLQDASGSGCDAYEAVLRAHLHHLINIAVGKLEREMEGFTDSPVSYRLPQEIMETLGLGENTQSQLPQDNAEAMATAVDYADGWRPVDSDNLPADNQLVEIRRENGKRQKARAYVFSWVWQTGGNQITAWRPA